MSRRLCMPIGFAISLLIIAFGLTTRAALGDEDVARAIKSLKQAAIAWPSNDKIFDAYLSVLPKDSNGNYFLEGDVLATREDVRVYLQNFSAPRTENITSNTELKLALNPLTSDKSIWPKPDRKLTYTINAMSFGSHAAGLKKAEEALGALTGAIKDWVDACLECGFDIKYVAPENAGELFENVTFVLEYDNSAFGPIARAFFPYDPKSIRAVVVFPEFFSPLLGFDKIGVMRHEFGHVLGYRHEHIEGIPDCQLEDNHWIRITPYDPKSVMHYLCGGKGNEALEITETDKAGHRCVYELDLDETKCAGLNVQ